MKFYRVRIILEEWEPSNTGELRGQTVFHSESLKQAQGVFDVLLCHPFCRDETETTPEQGYGGGQDPERRETYLESKKMSTTVQRS